MKTDVYFSSGYQGITGIKIMFAVWEESIHEFIFLVQTVGKVNLCSPA